MQIQNEREREQKSFITDYLESSYDNDSEEKEEKEKDFEENSE